MRHMEDALAPPRSGDTLPHQRHLNRRIGWLPHLKTVYGKSLQNKFHGHATGCHKVNGFKHISQSNIVNKLDVVELVVPATAVLICVIIGSLFFTDDIRAMKTQRTPYRQRSRRAGRRAKRVQDLFKYQHCKRQFRFLRNR